MTDASQQRTSSRVSPVRARLQALARHPLTWILFANLVLHGIGLGWGLPSSVGWDDDGVAPRDFLPGVVQTYQWGSFYTYPPVHLLLLTVLTAPAWIVGLLRAGSLAPDSLVAELTKVPYMTVFSVVARLVSLAMSIGIVYALFCLSRELWGRRVALVAALVVTTNIAFTYYAHTSNLDVPYIFWGTLALLETARAIQQSEPRRLRWVALYASLAIGTKDQAYALFVPALPVIVLAWVALDRDIRGRIRELARECAIAGAMGVGSVLLIDGALFNPAGFAARLHFLTGPASQNHAVYSASAAGLIAVLRDSFANFDRYYPIPFAALALIGLFLPLRRESPPRERALRFLPLVIAMSFTVAFNFSARRTEHRFLLPQMLLFGLYAGVGCERLLFEPRFARLARPIALALFTWAFYRAAAVDAALLGDPRYDAEAFMRQEMHPGDPIETYGNDAYLPRFPAEVEVSRIGPEPLVGRSQVPGIHEVRAPYAAIPPRHPEFIVFSEGWAWRYLTDPGAIRQAGSSLAPEQAAREKDQATRSYFSGLLSGAMGYRVAHVSERHSSFWPAVNIHSSTDKRVWILQRAPKHY